MKTRNGSQWKKKGRRVEGFEEGYHYEYAHVTIKDVVEVYKTELKVDKKFVVTNEQLTYNVLKNIIKSFD